MQWNILSRIGPSSYFFNFQSTSAQSSNMWRTSSCEARSKIYLCKIDNYNMMHKTQLFKDHFWRGGWFCSSFWFKQHPKFLGLYRVFNIDRQLGLACYMNNKKPKVCFLSFLNIPTQFVIINLVFGIQYLVLNQIQSFLQLKMDNCTDKLFRIDSNSFH